MERIEKRGVVVFVSLQGESNKRVGLYTEEGMLYFTLYGARGNKGHNKSVLALFTMGRFIFKTGARKSLLFVDVEIYDTAIEFANELDVYYAACTGAELVKKMIDAEHGLQFKLLVDFLLFLLDQPQQWREGIVVFLWKSLVHNGWQPETPLEMNETVYETGYEMGSATDYSTGSETGANASASVRERCGEEHVYYTRNEGFLELKETGAYTNDLLVEYKIIETLLHSNVALFKDVCMTMNVFSHKALQTSIAVLFDIWRGILGYKLTLSDFVIH